MKLSEQLKNITIIRRGSWIKVIVERLDIMDVDALFAITPIFKKLQLQLENSQSKIFVEYIEIPIFSKETVSIADTSADKNNRVYTVTLNVHKEGGDRPIKSFKAIKMREV